MELGLSLGDASKQFRFLSKNRELDTTTTTSINKCDLGFSMSLGINSNGRQEPEEEQKNVQDDQNHTSEEPSKGPARDGDDQRGSLDPHPVQLELLPLAPVPRRTPSHQRSFPWSSGSSEGGSSGNAGIPAVRGFDVNRLPAAMATAEEVSSPNSVASSSFQMDIPLYRGGNVGGGNLRESEAAGNDVVETERGASDDDENGLNTRKKLRLSKEQSAYLEESFKEHSTLNPKQKIALAKQLNLRPRQVEVWFQNRRARTKLKQTEVDCEYLKRCCETMTEENRRLHKELQELRALKTSNPFYMQLPATTLTMCPCCERVATTSTAAQTTSITTDPTSKTIPFSLSRPRFYPFPNTPTHPHQSAAS